VSGREPNPRAGRSADDDEDGRFDLAGAVEHAIESTDAPRLVELLETEVVVAEGAEPGPEGGYSLEVLEIAPSTAGYRDRPALPLWRALGADRVSELLVELLANAHGRGGSDAARAAAHGLAALAQRHPEVLARVRSVILDGHTELFPALDALAPGSARVDALELQTLARTLRSPRATAEDVVVLAPRLALGLPKLKKKDRTSLATAVIHLARSSSPFAPGAITALAEAGVPFDRELLSLRPIEAAALAGLVDNVRALERAGARPPRPKVMGRSAPARRTRNASAARETAADSPVTAPRFTASKSRLVAALFISLAFAAIAAVSVWGGVGVVVAYLAPMHLFVMSQFLEEESVFHPLVDQGWSAFAANTRHVLPPIVLLSATMTCGFLTKLADPSVLAAVTACLVVATSVVTRRAPLGSGDEASRGA